MDNIKIKSTVFTFSVFPFIHFICFHRFVVFDLSQDVEVRIHSSVICGEQSSPRKNMISLKVFLSERGFLSKE